jgi:hypothetical protein
VLCRIRPPNADELAQSGSIAVRVRPAYGRSSGRHTVITSISCCATSSAATEAFLRHGQRESSCARGRVGGGAAVGRSAVEPLSPPLSALMHDRVSRSSGARGRADRRPRVRRRHTDVHVRLCRRCGRHTGRRVRSARLLTAAQRCADSVGRSTFASLSVGQRQLSATVALTCGHTLRAPGTTQRCALWSTM